MKKIFIWNHKIELYQGKIDEFILNNQQNANNEGYEFIHIPHEIEITQLIDYLKKNNAEALLHRNEHGLLQCTLAWIEITNKCLAADIPVLSFDFGYFNHYSSFMVDFYSYNCISSIYKKWKHLDHEFKWSDMPSYIEDHRNRILNNIELYKNDPPPLGLNNIVTIWGQWTTELIKHQFYQNGRYIPMNDWIKRLIPIIKDHGYTPVVKMSPVKSLTAYEELQHQLPIFVGNKKHQEELPATLYEENINYKLIAHSKFNIINCSSVSNELFINNSKVIATGRSWFDGVGVFYEPRSWDKIMDYTEPNSVNKNKWCNWWRDVQCKPKELPIKILQTIKEAKKYGYH